MPRVTAPYFAKVTAMVGSRARLIKLVATNPRIILSEREARLSRGFTPKESGAKRPQERLGYG